MKTLLKRMIGETLLGVIEYYRFPERRESWGGPFNGQKFRQQIFLELIKKIGFSAIVETGTYRGTTTEYLHKSSRLPVYTVELSRRNYGYVKARFRFDKNITLVHGDSRLFLRGLVGNPELADKRILFYLDAHWGEDLPLNEEIQIIFQNWPHAVLMVDDFKVPGDDGYGFDDYGNGKTLNLEGVGTLRETLKLATFFPACRAEFESGQKRGCVVFANASTMLEELRKVKSLTLHTGGTLNDGR